MGALRRGVISLLTSVFLRVFSMLSARLLVLSLRDDGLRCFLVA